MKRVCDTVVIKTPIEVGDNRGLGPSYTRSASQLFLVLLNAPLFGKCIAPRASNGTFTVIWTIKYNAKIYAQRKLICRIISPWTILSTNWNVASISCNLHQACVHTSGFPRDLVLCTMRPTIHIIVLDLKSDTCIWSKW